MGMFDNYKNINNTEKPDNRHLFCYKDETDEIIIGGTSTHIFKLHFSYLEKCREANWFQITYKQSLGSPDAYETYFDVQSPNVSYKVEDGNTIIAVNITENISKLFNKDRITFAQIKLYMKDGSIIYGDKDYIRVIDTLDRGE